MARGRPATKSSQKPQKMTFSKVKSTSKARKSKGEAPSGPSPEEFAAMLEFQACLVDDNDKHHHTFKKHDTIAILPNGFSPGDPIEPWEHWVGKIKEIRGERYADESNLVYAKVQWYYNSKDVAGVIKSFDPQVVGQFERIYSDHYDLVEPEAFDGVIPLYKFNEEDPEQTYIPRDSFFRRYTFEYRARNLQPKPGADSCICHTPYNPDDTELANLMHFCPRPSCRRAYHHGCLIAAKSKESPSETSTGATSIRIVPPKGKKDEEDGKSTIAVTRSRSAQKQPEPAKRGRPKRTKQKVEEEDTASLVESASSALIAGLSSRDLRLLACSPDTDEVVDLQDLVPFSLSSALNGLESEEEDQDDEDEDEKDAVAKTESSDEVSAMEVEEEPPKKRRRGRPPKVKPIIAEPDVIRSQPKWKLEPTSPVSSSFPSGATHSLSNTVKKPAFASPTVKKPSSFGKPSKAKGKAKGKAKSSRTTRASQKAKKPKLQPQRVPLATLLSALPPEFLHVATQPMVRGGAFVKGGVSGNVGIITRARRMVYAYLAEAGGGTGGADVEVWEEKVFGMSVDEQAQERAIEWDKENAAQAGPKGIGVGIGGRDSLDIVGLENAIVKIDGSKKPLPLFVCPKCKSAI